MTEIEQAEIHFVRSGKRATWRSADQLSILELAERSGLSPDYGCRAGACQTCETRMLLGEVHYEFEPLAVPGPGNILLCCSRPQSPVVELDL